LGTPWILLLSFFWLSYLGSLLQSVRELLLELIILHESFEVLG